MGGTWCPPPGGERPRECDPVRGQGLQAKWWQFGVGQNDAGGLSGRRVLEPGGLLPPLLQAFAALSHPA